MSDEFGYSSVDGLVGDVKPPDNLVSVKSRKWWYQEVIGKHGLFPCYGVFLALPSDDQVIEYFTKYTNEINLITGKNCLLIALTKHRIRVWGDNEKFWKGVVDEHIGEGYNIEFAKLFNIDFVQFPCLLIFENTNSESRRWVGVNNYIITGSNILRKLTGIPNDSLKKYLAYWGHYHDQYSLYGYGYYLRNIKNAKVPPQGRGVVALGIKNILEENNILFPKKG